MEKRWMLHTKRADFQGIARDLGIDPVTVRIIRNRGIREEEEMRRYLFGTLDDLYDPALLPQGEEAAALLREAISRGERIRIVGDYDIDGVCATDILYRGLLQVREALGRKEAAGGIDYVIPHRIRDGYGINRHIIEKALSDGVDLIITCDNGIAALEELRFAREQGVRVIVTDHHDIRLTEEGEEQLPPAEAVELFDRFITELTDTLPKLSVMLIAGNHDSGPRVGCLNAILSRQNVHMIGQPPRTKEEYMEKVVLRDQYGPVNFYLLPFVRPSMARRNSVLPLLVSSIHFR